MSSKGLCSCNCCDGINCAPVLVGQVWTDYKTCFSSGCSAAYPTQCKSTSLIAVSFDSNAAPVPPSTPIMIIVLSIVGVIGIVSGFYLYKLYIKRRNERRMLEEEVTTEKLKDENGFTSVDVMTAPKTPITSIPNGQLFIPSTERKSSLPVMLLRSDSQVSSASTVSSLKGSILSSVSLILQPSKPSSSQATIVPPVPTTVPVSILKGSIQKPNPVATKELPDIPTNRHSDLLSPSKQSFKAKIQAFNEKAEAFKDIPTIKVPVNLDEGLQSGLSEFEEGKK